jgi:hypothetical protein
MLAGCQLAGGPVVGVGKRGVTYGWNARARFVSTHQFYRRVADEAWTIGLGQVVHANRPWLSYANVGIGRLTGGDDDNSPQDAVRFGGFAEAGVATNSARVLPYAFVGAGVGNGGDFDCGTAGATFEITVGVRFVDTLEVVAMPAIGYAEAKGQCND